MGDHRAKCDVVFEMHGVKRELHLDWVNWFEMGDGIDTRVKEFFAEAYSEAMARCEERVTRPARDAAQEQAERLELARLKAKYER